MKNHLNEVLYALSTCRTEESARACIAGSTTTPEQYQLLMKLVDLLF